MNVRKLFLRCGWKIQSHITPGWRDAQYEYKDAVIRHVGGSSRWLDLGCGYHPFGGWMVKEGREALARAGRVVGLDYEFESLRKHRDIRDRVNGDAHYLPFADGSFDVVTANMVMEHFREPESALREIRRVLAKDGILIFHTPNAEHYQFRIAAVMPQAVKEMLVRWLEGRGSEDVFPTFYRINSMSAIDAAAAAAGFAVREMRMVNSSPETYMLGPLVALELVVIRMLDRPGQEKRRSNIVAILERRDAPPRHAGNDATAHDAETAVALRPL